MAKDPAILFYTSDFISGTITLSDEQRGQYIILLCLQHQKGHLSEKDMLKICKSHDTDIFEKFIKDANGLFYNERLEEEINKRKAYSESRRKNRTKKDVLIISKSHDEDMEDEDENKDINKEKFRVKKCLMRNSNINIPDIEEAFKKTDDLKNADAKYYYHSMTDWSDSKGEMRTDWIATARSFARKDLKDSKLKMIRVNKQMTSGHIGDGTPRTQKETEALLNLNK